MTGRRNKRGRLELETSARKSCKCKSKEVRVRITGETVGEGWSTARHFNAGNWSWWQNGLGNKGISKKSYFKLLTQKNVDNSEWNHHIEDKNT